MATSSYDEPSIRDLMGRTIDDGKAFVRAEVDLYKTIATYKVSAAKLPVIYIVVAVFLVQAALTTLLVAIGMGLVPHLGPFGGLGVAALIGFAVAGLLAWLAVKSFSK